MLHINAHTVYSVYSVCNVYKANNVHNVGNVYNTHDQYGFGKCNSQHDEVRYVHGCLEAK
jgi:hypothetical protein